MIMFFDKISNIKVESIKKRDSGIANRVDAFKAFSGY